MLLYYITDRRQFPGSAAEQRARVLETIAEAARAGIDSVQLREKDLTTRELERLARDVMRVVHGEGAMRLLINSRTDVALAVGADGVHLRGDDAGADQARAVWGRASSVTPVIAVSCHTADEVARAWSQGADFAVFGPVFEKAGERGAGLQALREACALVPQFPVLALGGVTLENAAECVAAGAAGIAAIRLFQGTGVGDLCAKLRAVVPG